MADLTQITSAVTVISQLILPNDNCPSYVHIPKCRHPRLVSLLSDLLGRIFIQGIRYLRRR